MVGATPRSSEGHQFDTAEAGSHVALNRSSRTEAENFGTPILIVSRPRGGILSGPLGNETELGSGR